MTKKKKKKLIEEKGNLIVQAELAKVGETLEKKFESKFEETLDKLIKDYGGAKKLFNDDGPEPKAKITLEDTLKAAKDFAVTGKAPDGMGELIPSDGGYFLSPQIASEIIATMTATGLLYPKCRKVTIGPNANSLIMNAVDETSRATGSRWGGVRGYWVDEAATLTTSKYKLRRMRWELKKLGVAMYMTDEMVQDAVASGSVASQAVGEEFGFMVDDALLNGSGAGQPLGILNSGCLVSQSKETGQTAATIVAENILKMWNRMSASMRTGAEWYINQDCEQQLEQMFIPIGTAGIPVYMPPGAGFTTGPNGNLRGRPIVDLEQCQALGTKGDIYFANFKHYLVIDKGGVNSSSSIHVKFLSDQMTYKWTYRVDGQPLYSSAVTAYKGSTTRSPFVALATRA